MSVRRGIRGSAVKPGPGVQVDRGDPLSQGLIGCWLFSEGAGFLAADAAGCNAAGAIPSACTWAPGKFGPCLTGFPASAGGGVSIPDNSLNHTLSSYTIAAWVYSSSPAGGYQFLVSKDTVNDNYSYLIVTGTSKMSLRPNSATDYFANTVLAANRWYHVAVTVNGTAIQHYNNGLADGSGTSSGSPILDGTALLIGNTTGFSAPWQGGIDNVRLYNRALSQAEIQQLYAEPFAGLVVPRRKIGRAPLPPASVSASITLGALTSSVAATNLDHAAASITFGSLACAGAANDLEHASASITLGALTSSAAATNLDHAAAAITLGSLACAAAGTNLDHASASIMLGSLTCAGTALQYDAAQASITLGALTSSAAATNLDHAEASITLGNLTCASTAAHPVTGSASITLGALTCVGAGTNANTAAASITLGALACSGAANDLEHATASITLGPLVCAGTGTNDLDNAAASITLGALTCAGAAIHPVIGSASLTMGALTLVGSGTQAHILQASIALGALTGAGAATNLDHAAAAITLGALACAGAANDLEHASASITLGPLTCAGTGLVAHDLVASIALGSLTCTAAATNLDHAAAAITLGSLACAGTIGTVIHAAASITLGSLRTLESQERSPLRWEDSPAGRPVSYTSGGGVIPLKQLSPGGAPHQVPVTDPATGEVVWAWVVPPWSGADEGRMLVISGGKPVWA